MKTRVFTWLIILNFLLAPVQLPSLASFSPTSANSTPLLHLKRGTFDARAATLLSLPSGLTRPAPGPYQIIQLKGPITPSDRADFQAAGLDLLEYLPDYAFLAQGTPAAFQKASALPQFYASTPFTLADKLDPVLFSSLEGGQGYTGMVQVSGWAGDQGQLDSALAGLGIGRQFQATPPLIAQVARLEPVRWIEPVFQQQLFNNIARTLMHVDTSAWTAEGLYGAGQVVAIADSGLDTGNLSTLSADFQGKVQSVHELVLNGGWADTFGHGTHVAGSIAGAGLLSGANPATHSYPSSSITGIAPEAHLVIQAFQVDSSGNISGIPNDLNSLFDQAYLDQARIHSDSWGGPTGSLPNFAGGYTLQSQQTDSFVWNHPDMSIFLAAGNYGHDGTVASLSNPLGCNSGTGNGLIDQDSITSPGTAKNAITVGASESNRNSGGDASSVWSDFGACFSTPPISTDRIANNPSGMAAFSSRGPTDDGRIKPDLVAPGTNIVSDRSQEISSFFSPYWPLYESNSHYAYSNGTSMATPLAAGAGALVREWLGKQGFLDPSAAALKAVLLNTTSDLAPGQYGTVSPQPEIPTSRPNNVEGWGRVDLSFMSAIFPYKIWLDDHTSGLATSSHVTYSDSTSHPLIVTNHSIPLRIMLVWTDPPASSSAGQDLVNDLDLKITGPGGVTYWGNGGTQADRINNVEGVIINNPPLGRYQVQVIAHHVPVQTQPYALVVSGALDRGILGLSAQENIQPSIAVPGMSLHLKYQLNNTGTVTATNLSASSSLAGLVSLPTTSLASAASTQGEYLWTIPASSKYGLITDTLTITGTSAISSTLHLTIHISATALITDTLSTYLPMVGKGP